MATALVTSSIEQPSAGRTLVTLSRGTKLVTHLNSEPKESWSIPNATALAPYLEGSSVFVTCVDVPLDLLTAISDHATWLDAGAATLFLHGYDGRVETIKIQDQGTEVHLLSRDFLALGDYENQSLSKAMASALSIIAKVTFPERTSAFDFFEAGGQSPEFDRVIWVKDFGHTSADGFFCPVVIGRY